MSRVLIVEDDATNARVFEALITRRLPGEALTTESAEELFERARRHEVDVVLMDVSLRNTVWQGRKVNGVELTRLLKADPATAHIPVILVTACAMQGDAERLMGESGANAYVSKPVADFPALLELIRLHCRRVA